MFRISEDRKSIETLEERSLADLNCKETDSIHEWIRKEPSCLDENLLIIQSNFSDFSNSNQELDLLALDKDGNLVIIEVKRDDKDKNITWQALRYAAACASFSKEDIFEMCQDYLEKFDLKDNAENYISEFIDGNVSDTQFNLIQRIILVASDFPAVVKAVAIWLNKKVDIIKCIQFTTSASGNEYFIHFQKIIPLEVEQIISYARNERSDQMSPSESAYKEFWVRFLNEMKKRTDLFGEVSPVTRSTIVGGAGITSILYRLSISKKSCSIELYIDRKNKMENKMIFDDLRKRRSTIEKSVNQDILWERCEDKRYSCIKIVKEISYLDRSKWPELIDFMIESIIELEGSLKKHLGTIRVNIRSGKYEKMLSESKNT